MDEKEAVGAEARPLSDPEVAERGGGFAEGTESVSPAAANPETPETLSTLRFRDV